MEKQILKDVANNIIGYIETQPDGIQVLKNAHGKIKGYYEPAGDHTRDENYNIVAKGNSLRTMIC
ncbi:MAG TPA: hypothetical protein VJM76_03035 [Gammaproteobacteria bacterium]|nr:hypothetical protein [Gammaproteobacteria bacterium]